MGDGVLKISENYIRRVLTNPSQKLPVKSWKYGEPTINRPFSVKEYLDNGFDRFRSTMYHEYGHHVHQMKYVTKNDLDYDLYRFEPEIEKKTRQLFVNLRAKEGRFIGNSTYGDSKFVEFFFFFFWMFRFNRMEKVRPEFKKLIKEIEDEVGR